MAFGVGRLIITQATLRVPSANTPVTLTTVTESPSLAITAGNSNGATVFVTSTRLTNATDYRRGGIPLTAGQTFTFTGIPVSGAQYRNICFGTGYTYFNATATPCNVILTYYTQS